MRDVFVAGTGMTAFGRHKDRTLRSLAEEAVADAQRDAGIELERAGLALFGNAAAGLATGQEMIRGQVALGATALRSASIVNVENACASGSTAFYVAWLAVANGHCDVAVAVGAEKLTGPDRQRSFDAINAAFDLERPQDLLARTARLEPDTNGGRRTVYLDAYASAALDLMDRTGATVDDFATVAEKNHQHGALNDKAQLRRVLTKEEVLGARSITGPLTLPMCSPIGDGAAVVILAAEAPASGRRVRVGSCVLASGGGAEMVERTARKALADAAVDPADLDVVELHDAVAPEELALYGELGLCAPDEAVDLLRAGATRLGGSIPVNPSGGLLSRGHPLGATGCAQLIELSDQLRGRAGKRQVEGAKVGLAENAGGMLRDGPAAVVITVLTG